MITSKDGVVTVSKAKGNKESKKGLPKRVGRAPHRLRHQNYLTRATCIACAKVFRSPKKRLAHVKSGHVSMIGWNQNRVIKSSGLFAPAK